VVSEDGDAPAAGFLDRLPQSLALTPTLSQRERELWDRLLRGGVLNFVGWVKGREGRHSRRPRIWSRGGDPPVGNPPVTGIFWEDRMFPVNDYRLLAVPHVRRRVITRG